MRAEFMVEFSVGCVVLSVFFFIVRRKKRKRKFVRSIIVSKMSGL